MSLSPHSHKEPELKSSKFSKVRIAAARAIEAYSARPLHSAFHLTLFGTILILFLGYVPLWQTWTVLGLLGGVEFHEWYVKDGYRSPLFSRYFTPRKKK